MDWRAIPGWSGYEVSDSGTVRSWRRSGCKRQLRAAPRTLTPQPDAKGYWRVHLQDAAGRSRHLAVHQAVALAWLGPATGPQVRHKDGNRSHNMATNLCWGTQAENEADKAQHGRHRQPRPRSKTTTQNRRP